MICSAARARARLVDLRARARRRRSGRSWRACIANARGDAETRARIERGAAITVVVLLIAIVVAQHPLRRPPLERLHEPGWPAVERARGISEALSSNRWTWWHEAWHAFTRHPFGGTGAGTFD